MINEFYLKIVLKVDFLYKIQCDFKYFRYFFLHLKKYRVDILIVLMFYENRMFYVIFNLYVSKTKQTIFYQIFIEKKSEKPILLYFKMFKKKL